MSEASQQPAIQSPADGSAAPLPGEPSPGQTPEEAIQKIYDYAASLMIEGLAPRGIEKELVKIGLNQEDAAHVVKNLMEMKANAIRSAGKQNMLYGALWCIGGTAITVATLAAAEGGGTYVVAWGAIVFGGFQFFRGLWQTTTGR